MEKRRQHMRKALKRCLTVLTVTAWPVCIAVSLYFAYATASDETLVYNQILSVQLSPDGRYKAYVFIRNINATTDETYQLMILRSYEGFKDNGGNTYISEWPFEVSWKSDEELVVTTGRVDERYSPKQRTEVKGVEITYLAD